MKKWIQICLSFVMALLITSFSSARIYAQSGEGIDGCNYYWEYGFSDESSCRAWLDYKENEARPEWIRRLAYCIVYAGGYTIGQARSLIKQAIISPGGSLI